MEYLNRRVRLPQGYFPDGRSKPWRFAVVIAYYPTDETYIVCAIAKYEDDDTEVYLNRRMMDEYACVSVVTESCS
jgi:hypothetical protein